MQLGPFLALRRRHRNGGPHGAFVLPHTRVATSQLKTGAGIVELPGMRSDSEAAGWSWQRHCQVEGRALGGLPGAEQYSHHRCKNQDFPATTTQTTAARFRGADTGRRACSSMRRIFPLLFGAWISHDWHRYEKKVNPQVLGTNNCLAGQQMKKALNFFACIFSTYFLSRCFLLL